MFAPENKQILLLDGEDITLGAVAEVLGEIGYPVTACRSLRDALAVASDRELDLALVGAGLPRGGPAAAARRLRGRQRPELPVLVMAPPERLAEALRSLRKGLDDYITLPPDPDEIRLRVGRILEAHDLDTTMAHLHHEIVKRSSTRDLVGRSAAMRAVIEKIEKIAPMKSTILITGESGVGKELVARAIHSASPRKGFPFLAINCSAIPETLIESELFGHEKGAFTGAVGRTRGKFELAHRGTLFLDEIGEMNPSAQVKLLRVLEEREFMRVGGDHAIRVDVRVLAATNADLEQLVRDGRFRRDLYFRLKVVALPVPPLRERREDIPVLVRHFVEELCRANNLPARRVTDKAMARLQSHQWPGNVRELKNLLESLLVSTTGTLLDLPDLPAPLLSGPDGRPPRLDPRAGMTMQEMERELIRRTLEHTRGNRTRAARMLRIGVRTLQRKIALFDLR